MPHSRQRRYASATGTRTTSTTRSTLLTPAEEDQCVKRRRGTSTAARSRTQTLKKYRRQNIGDIPSLTNEMSTGPKVNGSTNINSQDEIGQSDVSVNSLLKCVSGAMKTLHDHVLNANTLRPPCDNHVTLPDLSILPKDVLSQQLQPVVTLLKKLRIEAVLPSLQPVEETIEETVNNDHTIASVKASLGDGYVNSLVSAGDLVFSLDFTLYMTKPLSISFCESNNIAQKESLSHTRIDPTTQSN